ncbi:MAG: sugar ABC transporter ATP-binding protein [Oscillospiraceae bacterium]|nr:sugar ABC transporter ATP-binding protein [Oscillospiraceae bacterium]
MGFKDMVAADIAATFLDSNFFGEPYRIEGKTVLIVIDNDQLKERQGGQDLAVAESATLFHASAADLPPRKAPGSSLNVNGRECLIDDWTEAMGVATIALRENIVA